MLISRLSLFCFAVAANALVAKRKDLIPSEANLDVATDPNGVTWPWLVFKTTDATPPNMTITGNGQPLADGYIFMTPATSNLSVPYAEESTGFIMTSDGDLVYALNVTAPTDFRRQYYDGKEYLTYWNGFNSQGVNIGHGYGQVTFLDETYTPFVVDPFLGLNKLTDTPVANWSIDIHEQQMSPRNTLVVSSYNNTQYDLSSVGGPVDGWVVDAVIFEIDIANDEVLFEWHGLDHLPLSASHQPLSDKSGNGTEEAPWDWFHVNSVQAVGDDYLINARHHWAFYMVSGKDGSINWSVEGETGGSFGTLPSEGTFRWEHFVRAHNATETSLDVGIFDNHASAIDNGTAGSRGLVYHLELPASKSYTPELLRRIETPSQGMYAESQGSYAASLPNGNQLLGYGQIAITREYGPATDGSDLRWQAQFGGIKDVQSYRAFKETWSGTPEGWDPVLVVEDAKAYVSWNGATEVSGWAVYAGSAEGKLTKAGVATRKGFETVFQIPKGAKCVQVAAVQHGSEVRKSNIVEV